MSKQGLMHATGIMWLLLTASANVLADFESAVADYRQSRWKPAFTEFTRLAEAGDARAQTVVALMHISGEGTPPNAEMAYYWYTQAADQGYPAAAYHVGTMLADGIGVTKDETAAKKYLTDAANQGHKRALLKLDELNAVAIDRPTEDQPKQWSRQWDLRLPSDAWDSSDNFAEIARLPTYRVQLGAMSTQQAAANLWQLFNNHSPRLFANVSFIVKKAPTANGEVYRLQAGPFDTQTAAEQFCSSVKYYTGKDCLTVAPADL